MFSESYRQKEPNSAQDKEDFIVTKVIEPADFLESARTLNIKTGERLLVLCNEQVNEPYCNFCFSELKKWLQSKRGA